MNQNTLWACLPQTGGKPRQALANSFGPWDPKEYTVEDSAFGFVVMKNGATVFLESSWALNTLEIGEAQTTLCGTLGGADMRNGLRINGQKYGKHFIETPQLGAGGVDFYQGESMDPNESRHGCFTMPSWKESRWW